MPDYHLLNTNKKHMGGDNDGTEIYDLGVAATYGGTEYGKKLKPISEDDIILSYVNGVGFRAVGRVTEEWSGEPVPEEDPQASPEHSSEYHVQVDWERVLPEAEAIDLEQANRLLAYSESTPANFTRKTVSDPEAGKRLADAIRGRRGDEPNLFLVPAGRDSNNLSRTVENPVPKSKIRNYDPTVDMDQFEGDAVPVWGHQEEKPIEGGRCPSPLQGRGIPLCCGGRRNRAQSRPWTGYLGRRRRRELRAYLLSEGSPGARSRSA